MFWLYYLEVECCICEFVLFYNFGFGMVFFKSVVKECKMWGIKIYLGKIIFNDF